MLTVTVCADITTVNLQQGLRKKPQNFYPQGSRPLIGNLHTQERFYLKKKNPNPKQEVKLFIFPELFATIITNE